MHKVAICNSGLCTVLPYPSYNPDLAPSELHVLGRLKDSLQGSHFEDDDELKNGSGDWAKS